MFGLLGEISLHWLILKHISKHIIQIKLWIENFL